MSGGGRYRKGRVSGVCILKTVCLLLLLHYIDLEISRAGVRCKEMGRGGLMRDLRGWAVGQ